jgi:plastocyanin
MSSATARLAFAFISMLTLSGAFAATKGTAVEVSIDKMVFVPKEITISPGTRVTWTNHDQTPHLLTDRRKVFASKALDTDDSYSFTFTQAGDVAYFCTLHPFMTGIVHVRGK